MENITEKQFVAKYGITIACEETDRNPNIDADEDWAKTATHYRCTLRRKVDGKTRTLTVYYSLGRAYTEPPTAEDVLDNLGCEALGYDVAGSFEEWAPEYGYGTDSRKAERTYRAVERESRKLRAFLGEEVYKELLHDTERL